MKFKPDVNVKKSGSKALSERDELFTVLALMCIPTKIKNISEDNKIEYDGMSLEFWLDWYENTPYAINYPDFVVGYINNKFLHPFFKNGKDLLVFIEARKCLQTKRSITDYNFKSFFIYNPKSKSYEFNYSIIFKKLATLIDTYEITCEDLSNLEQLILNEYFSNCGFEIWSMYLMTSLDRNRIFNLNQDEQYLKSIDNIRSKKHPLNYNFGDVQLIREFMDNFSPEFYKWMDKAYAKFKKMENVECACNLYKTSFIW